MRLPGESMGMAFDGVFAPDPIASSKRENDVDGQYFFFRLHTGRGVVDCSPPFITILPMRIFWTVRILVAGDEA
jgi:hypothetical protein